MQAVSGVLSPPGDSGGPVFSEPWQAQAFALAITLSEQGHFTWKEWTLALSNEFQAAASRGEADDGSRYYEHWLAALERLVTAKGLTGHAELTTRKQAWTDAYIGTPHGLPVVLPPSRKRVEPWWFVLALLSGAVGYGLLQLPLQQFSGTVTRLLASAGIGTLLGMRHALEPDHLAALSTLLTGERNVRRAAWLGVYWGVGHTLTLLVAGTLLVLLRADMPGFVADALAAAVVLLLIGFGFRAIALATKPASSGRTHSHTHAGLTVAGPADRWSLARRPLLVGAVHGLAGSGALTALVMATIPSTGARLVYLALFGIGSTLGMAALSGLMGWPIARVGTHRAVTRGIAVAVGCISIVLGLYWGLPLVRHWFQHGY